LSSRAVGGSIRVVRYSLSLILVVAPVLVLAARSRRPDSRIPGSQEKPGQRAGKRAWSHASAAPAQRARSLSPMVTRAVWVPRSVLRCGPAGKWRLHVRTE